MVESVRLAHQDGVGVLTQDCNAVAKSPQGKLAQSPARLHQLKVDVTSPAHTALWLWLNLSKTPPALCSSAACLDPDTLLLLALALGKELPSVFHMLVSDSYSLGVLTLGLCAWLSSTADPLTYLLLPGKAVLILPLCSHPLP